MSDKEELKQREEQTEIDPATVLEQINDEAQICKEAATEIEEQLSALLEQFVIASQNEDTPREVTRSLLDEIAQATTSLAKYNALGSILRLTPELVQALYQHVEGLDNYLLYLEQEEAAGHYTAAAYSRLWFLADHLAELLPYIADEAEAYKKETGKEAVAFEEFARPIIDPETGADNSPLARVEKRLQEAQEQEEAAERKISEEGSKGDAPHSYYLPPYSALPTSPATNFLLQTFNTGLKRQMEGSARNRHEVISYAQKGDTLEITRTRTRKDNEDKTIITVADAQAVFSGKSKGFTKIFCYTLQQMNSQFFPREVVIDLQEMVELGMYSRPDAAARAMIRFFNQQKNTTISGQTYKRGKREPIEEEGGQLFYHYKRRGTKFILYANENFNLDYLAQYYTTFPTFCYKLKSNAFALAEYIFFLARQNTNGIKKTGGYTISFESIRQHLGLPTPEEASKTRHYQQDIIGPIEAAIEEIEDVVANEAERTGSKAAAFTLTPIVADHADITEWLGGKLEVKFNADLAKAFIEIADNQEKQIARYKKAMQKEQAKIAAKKAAQGKG